MPTTGSTIQTLAPFVLHGVGRSLAAAVCVMARVRRTDKPMHPRGETTTATLRRLGSLAGTHVVPSGAKFLDGQGEQQVIVRQSRSVGFPPPLPDVHGLALRVPTEGGGHADILMSSTGRGRWSRFVLRPGCCPRAAFLSTLLPHRTPSGPALMAARASGRGPGGRDRWQLLWARPAGPWHLFAVLELSSRSGTDQALSFDAVTAAPDGLEVYDWHRWLRGPSYVAARRSRAGQHQDVGSTR